MADAKVTRRHREIVMLTRYPDRRMWPREKQWIESGSGQVSEPVYLDRQAQALANIEAEALADREHLELGCEIAAAHLEMTTAVSGMRIPWLEAERIRKGTKP